MSDNVKTIDGQMVRSCQKTSIHSAHLFLYGAESYHCPGYHPARGTHHPAIRQQQQTPRVKESRVRGCFQPEAHDAHTWGSSDNEWYCPGGLINDSGRFEYALPPKQEEPTEAPKNEGDETDQLLASRRSVYGDRVTNMERTAALWSALLGIEVKDWQVPLMMSAYKMLRTFETPDYSDNSDDIVGWERMFEEVMDKNHGGIIKARTVEEYHAAKQKIQDQRDGQSIEAWLASRKENYNE